MEKTTKFLIGGVLAILLFAVLYFLFQSDEGGITGLAALALLDYGFWIPVIICTAIAIGLAIFAAKSTKLNDKGIIAIVIIAVALFFAPWGKACTVKSDPVQAPKYQPK